MKFRVPLISYRAVPNCLIGSTLLFTLALYACVREESPQMEKEVAVVNPSSVQPSEEMAEEVAPQPSVKHLSELSKHLSELREVERRQVEAQLEAARRSEAARQSAAAEAARRSAPADAARRTEAARLKPQAEKERHADRLSNYRTERPREAAPLTPADAARRAEAAGQVARLESQRIERLRRGEQAQSANPQASDAFAVVQEIMKNMEQANIAFNTPKTINRNDTVMIHLLLSLKEAEDELKEKIKEKGEKESAIVQVSPIMEARLTGPNFQITAVTPEEQGISRQENTEWKWEVKPQASGEQHLHLTLNAIFMVNGSQRKWSVRSFDKIITVHVTTSQQLAGFVGTNWQWLWTVLAAPLVVALWNHQNGKTRKTRKK